MNYLYFQLKLLKEKQKKKMHDIKNIRQNSSIKYIPFNEPAPARRVGLLHRSTSTRRICFQNLAGMIQDITKKEFPINSSVEILNVR